jgi:hypothetical protein
LQSQPVRKQQIRQLLLDIGFAAPTPGQTIDLVIVTVAVSPGPPRQKPEIPSTSPRLYPYAKLILTDAASTDSDEIKTISATRPSGPGDRVKSPWPFKTCLISHPNRVCKA